MSSAISTRNADRRAQWDSARMAIEFSSPVGGSLPFSILAVEASFFSATGRHVGAVGKPRCDPMAGR